VATNNQYTDLAHPLLGGDLALILADLGIPVNLQGPKDKLLKRAVIDSRALNQQYPASVFFALKGERTDGHTYVSGFSAQSVSMVVVTQAWSDTNPSICNTLVEKDIPVLSVPDPLTALQAWAGEHRRSIVNLRRVGVTGSSGKTTTKDLLRAVGETHFKTWATEGNLNSVIGMPLAVLGLPEDTKLAIFEMAMSAPGEMKVLANIVEPDLAICTGIGTAHLAQLGSQDAIAREKRDITSAFNGQQSFLIPESDAHAGLLSEQVNGNVVRFGEKSCEGFKSWKALPDGGQQLDFLTGCAVLPLSGAHIRSDFFAVLQASRLLGIPDDKTFRGVASFKPAFGRGQVSVGRCRVVLDCYNANPESMAASIHAFAENVASGRKVLVLGDMLELGTVSRAQHEAIGDLALSIKPDVLLFFGSEMAAAYKAVLTRGVAQTKVLHAVDFGSLSAQAAATIQAGDTVLLKASRGMELERLEPVIQQHSGGSGHV